MIARLSVGWQTTIADLALILFMVTAAGLNAERQSEARRDETMAAPAPRGEPLALYRADPAAPPIGEWLAEQAPDGRQYLTIVARYSAGEAADAARRAAALADQAGAAGTSARIVLEPGDTGDLFATLAFDRPTEPVAHSLQQ